MRFKRTLCAALTVSAALGCLPPAGALANVSSWATDEVAAAKAAGLEPASLAEARATAPVTRAEFCEVALALYEKSSGKTAPDTDERPFTDTTSAAVASAHALGLVTGRGSGVFDPKGAVTRQELCKMLDNVLTAAGRAAADPDPEALGDFGDKGAVASWATEPVARMLGAGILRGVSRTAVDPTGEANTVVELKPTGTTTREQALIAALRFTDAFPPAGAAPQTPSVSPGQDVADPDAGAQSKPSKDDEPESPAPAEPGTVPSKLPETEEDKMNFVFGSGGSYFATPELAEAAMTEISVPVWRLKDGKKTADKAYVTVNRNLAAIYTAVFIEIYNGDEKFPISDVGSYAWRSSPTSEHRWGTAIDLNYEANMECYIDGEGNVTKITTGTHWTPGEDPLSIPEDGDVYNAFTKYGFSWGGNAWKTKRDYMHFSYFGR